MKQICPKADVWHAIHQRLEAFAKLNPCNPAKPPIPLILAGWVYTNDQEKKLRWEETVNWAKNNSCYDLVSLIEPNEYFYSEEITTYQVGPGYGPMYLPWNFDKKSTISNSDKLKLLSKIKDEWHVIAGDILYKHTLPCSITGKKSRRLLVKYENDLFIPPWGSWVALPKNKELRYTFTMFRKRLNDVIAPYVIDHVDFFYTPAEVAK